MQFAPYRSIPLTPDTYDVFVSADGTRLLMLETIESGGDGIAIDTNSNTELGILRQINTRKSHMIECNHGFRCIIFRSAGGSRWNPSSVAEFNWKNTLHETWQYTLPDGFTRLESLSPDGLLAHIEFYDTYVAEATRPKTSRVLRLKDLATVYSLPDQCFNIVDWTTLTYVPLIRNAEHWQLHGLEGSFQRNLPRFDSQSSLTALDSGMLCEQIARNRGLQLHDLVQGLTQKIIPAHSQSICDPDISESRHIRFVLGGEPKIFTIKEFDLDQLEKLSLKNKGHETGIWHPSLDFVLWNQHNLHLGKYRQKNWSFSEHGRPVRWLKGENLCFVTFAKDRKQLVYWHQA